MSNSPADDIKDYIEDNTDLVFGTDLFVAAEPKDKDNVVTIYDTGGFDADPKFALDSPTIQIRVKNNIYKTGYLVCEDIKNQLLYFTKQSINDSEYIGIWQQGDITPIGRDENNRFIFTMNFRLKRIPADTGNRQPN